MQPTRRRLFRLVFAWSGGIFLTISIVFSLVIAPLQASWGAREFEVNFDSKNFQGAVDLDLDEWSSHFAGAFGLNALDRFSHDPNLVPSGRKIATEIREHILTGRHQLYLADTLRKAWYFWPISCAVAYVYVVDGFITGHWISAPDGPEYPY